jgi:hypothetical protein
MKRWTVSVDGDQAQWLDFCESFMSDDIDMEVTRDGRWICHIALDPHQPIDSTGSMPSFVDQAVWHGKRHGFHNVVTVEVVVEE